MEIGVHGLAMQAVGDTGESERPIAAGAVIAGDPAVPVSGGAGHRCAPGAAPMAAVVRA